MIKYSFLCSLCNQKVDIGVEATNMQDFKLDISSQCPNISSVSNSIKNVDAIKETITKPQNSEFRNQVIQLCDKPNCTIYDSIRDAVEQHLGWYHQVGI